MGGRGASSGVSVKGKKYGSEYHSVLKAGNIKFVVYNDSKSAKAPMETMTRGRVYVTVNTDNQLSTISYYDAKGKRVKTIDLLHDHNEITGEHVHHGYYHNENDGKKGATKLNAKENKMVQNVRRIWYNHINS